MKRSVILAFIALATSLAVYAGVESGNATQKANTSCCDKPACCGDDTDASCCESGCGN